MRWKQKMWYGKFKFHELHGFKSEEELKTKLTGLYHQERLSQPQIAKELGCLVGQISRLFRQFNIEVRSFAVGNEMRIRPDVPISTDQEQIINGILLGDGSLQIRKYVGVLSYSSKHKNILVDLQNKLPFEFCPIWTRIKRINGQVRLHYEVKSHGYRQLAKLHEKWYKPRKIVPNIALTPTTCYWWYLGDGSSGNNHLRFCTNAFRVKDVKKLIRRLPVPGILRFCRKKFRRKQPVIDVLTRHIKQFFYYIGPCKHPELRHRWIAKFGRSKNGERYLLRVDFNYSQTSECLSPT